MANSYNPNGGGAVDPSILAMTLLWDIPDAIVYDAASINWKVLRWNTTTTGVRSPHFLCNGVKWRLLCYPQGSPASAAQDSVSLYLDRGNFGQTTDLPAVCVQFCVVLSNPGDPSIFTYQTMAKRINPGEVLCGFDRFCSSAAVTRPLPGNSTSILSREEAEVTVLLRVMYDPADTLWLLGVPPRVSSFQPAASHTASVSQLSISTVSSSSSSIEVAGPGPSSTRDTAPTEVPAKPLPPCRAAYPGEECIICADEPLLFPKRSPTEVCQHEGGICLPCLQTHISAEIGGKGGVNGVACPAPNCSETLNYQEIKFWADEVTFNRYDRILTRHALGVEEEFVMCTNVNCDGGQIHTEGASAPIVTCYVCHHRTCFTHQMAWHDGFTCDEWDMHQQTRAGMATTAEYLTKFTKMCPRCKKPIEKNAGCDAMKCKLPAGCGHSFCWICLAPYDLILRDGNHRHHAHCRHYAAYDEPKAARPVTTPNVIYDPLGASTSTSQTNAGSSTSTNSASRNPYRTVTTLMSTPSVNESRPSYQPPSYLVASTSTGQSTSQPPPYTASTVSNAGSTSKSARKWFQFWKE